MGIAMNGNPFDALDLDPSATPDEITERLREMVEDASPSDRQRIRETWESLTLHPRSRVVHALGTFIDPEPEKIVRPPPPRPPPSTEVAPSPRALAVPTTELHATLVRDATSSYEPSAYIPLAADPLLKENRP
jgi:hypothetical protein